jgi:importin subunit alpha-6/7
MSERYIPEHRRTQFKAKNTFKPDELRRRREEQQVEIRKQKREENLAKRRGIQRGDGQIGVGGLATGTDSDDEAGTIEGEVRNLPLQSAVEAVFKQTLTSCSLAQYRAA